jgi:tetratricopeptide (TPR) repeat protein
MMADRDTSRPRRKRNVSPPTTPDPIEIAMEAAATTGPQGGAAELVLDRHAELLSIQIALAHDERLRARLKTARDLGLALIVLLLLAGAGWALWSASQARGLIVEGFAAPPDTAARGLSGEVLAARFLDKLRSIDATAYSTRAEQSLERDWAGDFQVIIPQTGVSAGAAYAQLQKALGQQTRISGDLVRDAAGGVSLTIRIPEQPSITVSGPEAELDGLLQTAAERVFGSTQPFRYSRYLALAGRNTEALSVAQRLARGGSQAERPWAYAQMALVLLGSDLVAAAEAGRRATNLMPGLGTGHFAYAEAAQSLGWEDIAMGEWSEASKMRFGGPLYSDRGVALGFTCAARAAEARGDYADAISLRAAARSDDITGLDPMAGEGDAARWRAALHDIAESRRRASEALPEQQPTIRHAQAVALGDWPAAVVAMEARIAAATPGLAPSSGSSVLRATHHDDRAVARESRQVGAAATSALQDTAVGPAAFPVSVTNDTAINPDASNRGYSARVRLERLLRPLLAIALARAGRIPEAQASLIGTPLDCNLCLRAQGIVAASSGDFAGAERFYREAVRRSPSSPFATLEWAEAKLAQGDAAGALPLLQDAKARGPRWADPLKLEGDALVRLGRDREAVPRFSEAADRAPRWGALHLAWGDALDRLGRREQAVAKWRAATGMDLSSADRATVSARLRGIGPRR